jgi:nucleotide-binding universal stress UspA family protein
MSRSRVVVGVNGSPSSLRAVEHGAAEAARRSLPLHLLHAWDAWPLYDGATLVPLDGVEEAEARVLHRAVEHLREVAPDVEVSTGLVQERADEALVGASRSAVLLVLGRHDGSRAWTGPVLAHVTALAHCPVVVVPPEGPRSTGDVVVGVDGSAVSAAAVDVAFALASEWGRRLVAVLAMTSTFDEHVTSPSMLEELRERGRRSLAESLAGQSGRWPDVEVVPSVHVADAVPVLLEAAQDAAMLVVGSHGRGALLRAALGSVSSSLLRTAPCPVVVVRPERAARPRVQDRRLAPAPHP